jgi:hypothetical protein
VTEYDPSAWAVVLPVPPAHLMAMLALATAAPVATTPDKVTELAPPLLAPPPPPPPPPQAASSKALNVVATMGQGNLVHWRMLSLLGVMEVSSSVWLLISWFVMAVGCSHAMRV